MMAGRLNVASKKENLETPCLALTGAYHEGSSFSLRTRHFGHSKNIFQFTDNKL